MKDYIRSTLHKNLPIEKMLLRKYKWGDQDVEVETFLSQTFKKILWISGYYPRVDGFYYYLTILQLVFFTVGEWFLSFTMFISIPYSKDNIVFVMRFLRLGFLCLAVNMCMWGVLWERGNVTKIVRVYLENYYDYEEDVVPEGLKIIEKERKSRMKYFVMIPVYGLYTGVNMIIVPLFYLQDIKLPEDIFDTKSLFPTWSLDPNSIWVRIVFLILLFTFIAHLGLGATGGFFFLIQLFDSLIGQTQFLNQSIGRLEERAEAHFNKMRKNYDTWSMEDSFIHCIKQNVQHHVMIFEFKVALERVLSFTIMTLSLNATAILASNAFLLVMQDDQILKILAICGLVTETYFLLTYNVYGQLLINESEKLRFTLYNLRWFNFSPRTKNMINIMQIMTTRLMRMSLSKGQMNLDLANFVQIVKKTYSLINFLIAVN